MRADPERIPDDSMILFWGLTPFGRKFIILVVVNSKVNPAGVCTPILRASCILTRNIFDVSEMSSIQTNNSRLAKPVHPVVVRPRVAGWASSVVTSVVVISFMTVYWICPKYFVEHSEPSIYGGAEGAVDVVKKGKNSAAYRMCFKLMECPLGGFPAYITSAIPFFLLMILVEFVVTCIIGILFSA